MNRLKKYFIAVMAITLLLNIGRSFAAEKELTVDQIVDKALQTNYYQGKNGRARVSMTIIDEQGRERRRDFTILRLDGGTDLGDQKFYVYFTKPSDVRKMAFMVWKHTRGDDDRERTSFVGSHFLYEDVSGRNKNEDNHSLEETTQNFYVLKCIPKEPDKVEFAYYKMWIHRSSFLVTQAEYYDHKGQKYRDYQALKVEQIQGYPTVIKAKMTDTKIGGHTIIEYRNVTYDIGLPDSIFTERYLRRAPIKYLK